MSANNFKLTLDTIAPNGSFTTPSAQTQLTYAQNSILPELSTDGAAYMWVWASASADGGLVAANPQPTASNFAAGEYFTRSGSAGSYVYTKADTYVANETYYEIPSGEWEEAATTPAQALTLSPDGYYYLHAIFMDDVGNCSAIKHSGQVLADTLDPTITEFYAHDKDDQTETDYANDPVFGAYLKVSDGGSYPSQIATITISGNIVGSPVSISTISLDASNHDYDAQLTFSAAATDPSSQTITITVTDNSGNTSTQNATIYYDTQPASATLYLYKPGTSTSLNDYISGTTDTTSPHYNLYDAVITTTDTDVKSYKIWEGDSEPSAWETWPQSPYASSVTDANRSFTTTDGTKTIHAKVKDNAGNITTCTVQTRTYDATVPALTINRGAEWIAGTSGTDVSKQSTAITYTATDATSDLASGSPSFTCNGTAITGVSGGSFTFSASTPGAAAGANTIRISATDNAGNSTYQEVVVNIEDSFTIDSLTLGGWDFNSKIYRAATEDSISVTVNNSTAPGSGRSTLNVWTDQVEGNTTVPNNTINVPWNSASQSVQGDINKSFAESAGNYLHVKAISAVGNVTYAHISFTCDYTDPIFTATIDTPVPTNTKQLNISIGSIADTLSGADVMKVYAGANTAFDSGADANWVTAANGTRSLMLASTLNSGTYEVLIDVRDKAGNVTQHNLVWEYDAVAPEGTIALKETDNTTKASPSADKTFKVLVTYTADSTDAYSDIQYKIWGDFAVTDGGTQLTEANSPWRPMTAASMYAELPVTEQTTTTTFYCTANGSSSTSGETKTVYFKLKDNAGNIKQGTSASFIYNPNAATLTISNVSNERISCVHDYRKTTSSSDVVDTTEYADMMSFQITADQPLYEIKVAAYTSATYPESSTTGASISAMAARSGSYGSNYHPTGNPLTLPITVVIDGQDYRTAIRTVTSAGSDANVDGTHYIVVFGKNNAGTWSIAGTKVS